MKVNKGVYMVDDSINPNHYNSHTIEPWDFICANRFDYLEGCVIKYISRHRKKNGLQDLKKAQAYINKMIAMYDDLYAKNEGVD